ncbi:MAG: hypothetical protein FWD49_05240 [Firmicutes bacterium]|nr:hypothetical protein [Bacillota bacterium]
MSKKSKEKPTIEQRAAKAQMRSYKAKTVATIISIVGAVGSVGVFIFFFLVMTAAMKSCSGI